MTSRPKPVLPAPPSELSVTELIKAVQRVQEVEVRLTKLEVQYPRVHYMLREYRDHEEREPLPMYKEYSFMTVRDTTKAYECSFCGKGFTMRARLSRHIAREHERARQGDSKSNQETSSIKWVSHACKVCCKKFSDEGVLQVHLARFHTGKKRVYCDACGKGFPGRVGLKQHVRSAHLKGKKFGCSECDKVYLSQGALKAHVKGVHGEEKPYQCQECGLRFPYVSSIQYHKKKAHPAPVDENNNMNKAVGT